MLQKHSEAKPFVIVVSSLFPSAKLPAAGIFIKERMGRVANELPMLVISPRPWFPFQGLIRLFKQDYRPVLPKYETLGHLKVIRPNYLSFPQFFRSADGFFMAVSSWLSLKKENLQNENIIFDAHFAYPDGYSAYLLSRWFNAPYLITVRGTEVPLSKRFLRRQLMKIALRSANQIISVSDSLGEHVKGLGLNGRSALTIGNGVDTTEFYPLDKKQCRSELNISASGKVIITVGGLVKRKGIHHVIDALPALKKEFSELTYLVVGGGGGEGNWESVLKKKVADMGLEENVKFLGEWPHDKLNVPLSSADVFVLATSNEGWANVFLEAFGCGLPVVTTDVGGNKQVVNSTKLGIIVPYDEMEVLKEAISSALKRDWDINFIVEYAKNNEWSKRVNQVVSLMYRVIKKKNRD